MACFFLMSSFSPVVFILSFQSLFTLSSSSSAFSSLFRQKVEFSIRSLSLSLFTARTLQFPSYGHSTGQAYSGYIVPWKLVIK